MILAPLRILFRSSLRLEAIGFPLMTEAEALLIHGALYRSRAGLRFHSTPSSGEGNPVSMVFAGLKSNGVSIYCDDAPILHFDLDGRWTRAYFDESHYLRSWDGSIERVDRRREASGLDLPRRRLDEDEAAVVENRVERLVQFLRDALTQNDRVTWIAPPQDGRTQPWERDQLLGFLDRVLAFDSQARAESARAYQRAYPRRPEPPPELRVATALPILAIADPNRFQDHLDQLEAFWSARLEAIRTLALMVGSDVTDAPPHLARLLAILNQRPWSRGRAVHLVFDADSQALNWFDPTDLIAAHPDRANPPARLHWPLERIDRISVLKSSDIPISLNAKLNDLDALARLDALIHPDSPLARLDSRDRIACWTSRPEWDAELRHALATRRERIRSLGWLARCVHYPLGTDDRE